MNSSIKHVYISILIKTPYVNYTEKWFKFWEMVIQNIHDDKTTLNTKLDKLCMDIELLDCK